MLLLALARTHSCDRMRLWMILLPPPHRKKNLQQEEEKAREKVEQQKVLELQQAEVFCSKLNYTVFVGIRSSPNSNKSWEFAQFLCRK